MGLLWFISTSPSKCNYIYQLIFIGTKIELTVETVISGRRKAILVRWSGNTGLKLAVQLLPWHALNHCKDSVVQLVINCIVLNPAL